MPSGRAIEVWTVRMGSPAERRAGLRGVLSTYLDVDPSRIEFDVSPAGRPSIRGCDLEFSFSDSGDRALVAVSRMGPVGVDIERLDARRPVRRIARRWFAPDEVAVLDALPGAEVPVAFHRCWSAKEAYAKGRGRGLAIGLGSFSVAGLVAPGRDRVSVDGWEVRSLGHDQQYAAAVAAPGSDWTCDRRAWNKAF